MDTRRLVLVDIENLVGAPRLSSVPAQAAWDSFTDAIDLRPADQVIIACDQGNSAVAFFAAPQAGRRLLGFGPDGADLALQAVLLDENVAARFDTVVIGSGDGIFTSVATDLRAQGVTVIAASRMTAMSMALRLACDNTIYIDAPRRRAMAAPLRRIA
jgi:hypothetical protein